MRFSESRLQPVKGVSVQGSSGNWSGGFDFGTHASLVGREVFGEKTRKLLCRRIKGRFVGPNIARNQYFVWHVWAFAYHIEAEHRIALSFRFDKCPTMDGIDDRASAGQLDTLPGAVAAPAPASVHQPYACAVL